MTQDDFEAELYRSGLAAEFYRLRRSRQREVARMYVDEGARPSWRDQLSGARTAEEASSVLLEAAAAGVPEPTLRKLRRAVAQRHAAARSAAVRESAAAAGA